MSRRKRHPADRPSTPPPAGRGAPPGEWLWGVHAVAAALANPARRVHRLVVTPDAAAALRAGLPAGIAPEHGTRHEIARLLPDGAVHQGIAAHVSALPRPALARALSAPERGEHRLLVVLDRVTDPQNVGAILRSAAAFGALAVIVTMHHAPPLSGALAKAASGALETVRFVQVVNLAAALRHIKSAGFWCLGLDPAARDLLRQDRAAAAVALVLGAEGQGLRRLTREHCDMLVRLPTRPEVESLNVSNAAAVALYELTRPG